MVGSRRSGGWIALMAGALAWACADSAVQATAPEAPPPPDSTLHLVRSTAQTSALVLRLTEETPTVPRCDPPTALGGVPVVPCWTAPGDAHVVVDDARDPVLTRVLLGELDEPCDCSAVDVVWRPTTSVPMITYRCEKAS